jgi:hypothetical protein
MDKSRRYYLAGPMSGYPQFNIPLFDTVSTLLREQGLDVTSPAELDSEEMRRGALQSEHGDLADLHGCSDETWGDCLARDIKLIADVLDDIILLPEWHLSRGANLEATVGLLCGAIFYEWDAYKKAPKWVSDRYVIDRLYNSAVARNAK